MKKEMLAALFLVVLLGAGALTIQLPQTPSFASTDNESETENDEQQTESNDESTEEGGGSTDEETETEPEPETDTPPVQTDEPPVPVEPLLPEATVTEPEVTECPEGYVLDNDECVPDSLTELGELVGPPPECPPEAGLTPLECLGEVVKQPPETGLPPCDGSAQDCVTPNGDICLVGQGGHECECAEDMSDCPNHPSQLPPLESPSHRPLPYCDKVEDDPGYTGGCHDRQDFDDITGLYPCNDGVQEKDWRDCKDATDCKDYPNQYKCKPDDDDDDNDDDVDVRVVNKVVNIVKNVNERGHENFPEIDIIGLSTKQNGDSMVCLINIDNEHVQCQEYGMPSDRVNGDFWRIIETDQDKDYDNGNTGSNDIDGVIDDIKSQDFSELDDATNHDFDIDLAWIAINPSGDGVACLAEDSTGKGKSLCEPFKVSSEEIDGQITEGVAIENT